MSRRGRKRKDGPRGKSGRLLHVNPYDNGTPELQKKRQSLAGEKGDPRMTTTPIDILRTRGLIGEPEWEAAQRLLDLRKGYPRPHPKVMGDGIPRGQDTSIGGPTSDKYLEAMEVVKTKTGPSCVSAMFYAVVSHQWSAKMLAREDFVSFSKRSRLRSGLMALTYHFGMVRPAQARTT